MTREMEEGAPGSTEVYPQSEGKVTEEKPNDRDNPADSATKSTADSADDPLKENINSESDQSVILTPDGAIDSVEDSDGPASKGIVLRMASRLKRLRTAIVLTCLFALGVNHSRLSSEVNLTRPLPGPRPVLGNNSYLDVYDGELNTVYDEFLRHEMTVTLYYAPWDAKSLKDLKIFDELARDMPDVRFVAINCWQNPSCTKYYEFKFYPSISVYVRGLGSIQYPLTTVSKEYLATFIYNIINPVSVISDLSQWYLKRAKHFALVTVPMNYFQFAYTLALEALRQDPQQRVGYAVVNQDLAGIRLHLRNSTLVYDESPNPTVGAVSKWIYSTATEPFTYLGNPGYKSAKLRQAINGTRAFAIIKAPPSTRLNLQLHLLAVELFGCQDSHVNETRDMLVSLFMTLEAEASHCGKKTRPIECISDANECSNLMSNITYRKNWASYVTEYCRETEEEILKRAEQQRFCLTQWALPEKEPFVDDSLLFGLACGREDLFRLIMLDPALFDSLYPTEAPVVLYDTFDEVKYLLPESEFSARGIEIFLSRFLTNANDLLEKSTTLVRKDLYHRQSGKFVPPSEEVDRNIQDTVVLFYTNWCGFCKSFTATYFRVAHFFGTAPISFRRVDAEASRFEDFKYAPDSYPQVVFFPRNSSESIRYRGPWKAQGLTRFILEHCNEDVLRSF